MIKHLKNFGRAMIISSFFADCASGYQMINPGELDYQSKSGDSSIVVEYETNLLTGKYSKREIKSNVYLIAVRITNKTGRDITCKDNLKIFSG
jgi:hypothetical protein